MKKFFKILFLAVIVAGLGFFSYFLIGRAPVQSRITWGINFSQSHSEAMGLDWKENYLAVLENLNVKNIRLLSQWNKIEAIDDNFYFNDIDWQIGQAQKYGVKLIYVVGMKSGRWPECHMPNWAKGLSRQDQQEEILEYIKETVLRYKNQKSIVIWQVENEPLLDFGECPWRDEKFLKKEVEFIKSLDPIRPVIITDSGELSTWISASQIGDITGITMYRQTWVHIPNFGLTNNLLGFQGKYPLPPVFYYRKSQIIKYLFGKEVLCVELQAEPWLKNPYLQANLIEQEKSMNLEKFKENVEYAKRTGLTEFYLWGTEWWYWLKEKQDRPEIWDEAKKLFQADKP